MKCQLLLCSLTGLRVLVVGAGGGAGKAIATQMNQAGCASLILANRTVSKVQALADNLEKTGTEISVLGNSSDELASVANDVDIIINATSMGMKEDDTKVPSHLSYGLKSSLMFHL